MAKIKDTAVEPFLDALASQAATPGGGSAAAIIGAMGAALVSMVCNLTIGKKKYAEVEGEMKDVLAKSETLRLKLTGMIEDDVTAFDAVMAAYGMAKESDADKAAREKAIQAALKQATEVPLRCCHAAFSSALIERHQRSLSAYAFFPQRSSTSSLYWVWSKPSNMFSAISPSPPLSASMVCCTDAICRASRPCSWRSHAR